MTGRFRGMYLCKRGLNRSEFAPKLLGMVFRDFVTPPKQNLQLCITMNIVHLTNKALFKVVKAHYTPYGNLR